MIFLDLFNNNLKLNTMRTIDKIITNVNSKFGAPMGRHNKGTKPTDKKIFDCYVPMHGAYDKGGVYWGLGSPLRVSYTKDLSYIDFYRLEDAVYTYTIFRDGEEVAKFEDQKGDFCVLKYFIDKTSQSMDYAFKYNGYTATVTDKTNKVTQY